MRLHQVLTGAANVIDDSVAISHGNVNGFPFTVYGSGYEVVILDSHFNRVQIMSSQKLNIFSIVKCISCAKTDGKIAVSFGNKVVLYKAEQITITSETKLPYSWRKLKVLSFDSEVKNLCWDLEGVRLLVGSDNLHMWKNTDNDDQQAWSCVWHRKLSSPPSHLLFSPDGHYFASCGQGDRMVKIWFLAPKVDPVSARTFKRMYSGHSNVNEEQYNFVYILHPAEVLSFSWRNTSKHMPSCSVPNVLLTSCADTVCRIWSETVKYKPSRHTTPHTQRKTDSKLLPTFLGPSTHDLTATEIERLRTQTEIQMIDRETVNTLQDHQDYHLLSLLHFHLAAAISPSSDIALLSTIPTSTIFGRSFQLHWLNNKEIQFTTAIEAMYENFKRAENYDATDESDDPFSLVEGMGVPVQDLVDTVDDENTLDRTLEEEDIVQNENNEEENTSTTPPTESETLYSNSSGYKSQLNSLLHKWVTSTDTLFCIHPVDGSLLIWIVDHLDNFTTACYRQVQVSFASRIPSTFTKADASSLCWMRSYHYTQPVHKEMNTAVKTSTSGKNVSSNEQLSLLQVSYMISAHADGSLNLWLVTFSDSGSFTGIASITHVTRSCGPRFETSKLVGHPVLPLVLGTSKRKTEMQEDLSSSFTIINDIESELILWQTHHITPLSEFRGVAEMARISSPSPCDFSHVAWVPALYQHTLLSITSNSIEILPDGPCACFIVVNDSRIEVYQILLDAKNLLSNLAYQHNMPDIPTNSISKFIVSEQSGSHSACIMKLCALESVNSYQHTKFLHVYTKQSLCSKTTSDTSSGQIDSFFVAVVSTDIDGNDVMNVWRIEIDVKYKQPVSSPKSGDSILSSNSSAASPSLTISHYLKQSLIYCQPMPGGCRFSAASDLHCSNNLNPSCPIDFNFVAYSNTKIQFWNIVFDETTSAGVCNLEEPSAGLTSEGTIVCLGCANTERFAYVENIDNAFNVYINENQCSGGVSWAIEQKIPIEDVPVRAENMIELSWMHLENGMYLLAMAFNNAVFIYYKCKSEDVQNYKWTVLKEFKLYNEKVPLRLTTISWCRGGFFMVGVENEIQVYSQWQNFKDVVFRQKPVVSLMPEGGACENVMMRTKNSFGVACKSLATLPQYHPDHLMELLNLGKMKRVRAILKNLVECIAPEDIEPRQRTRTFSEISSFANDEDVAEVKQSIKSAPEINSIPPIMLSRLIAADNKSSSCAFQENEPCNDYKSLFDTVALSRLDSVENICVQNDYGTAQARTLSGTLARTQLPGLTRHEQMYLLVLSDTVAATNYDWSTPSDDNSNAPTSLDGGGGGYATSGSARGSSVDDCGLRYMMAASHFTALLKSAPLWKRKSLQEKGMETADICWAFHSECKEDLLSIVPSVVRNQPTWKDLRDHGAGWWIRSNELLRRTLEKVAKTHFQANQDPLDCAIFYLAMKKKSLICALYRSLRDTKMSAFFANDFTQDRWRKAALKNAYALLGKQRFQHAAAFFLLANALSDAVQVCMHRLNDLQLALVISRLFENNDTAHNQILQKYIINPGLDPPIKDPFLISMSYWQLRQYKRSLEVLLEMTYRDADSCACHDYPAIFNFYYYLHSHPLLKKLDRSSSTVTGDESELSAAEMKNCERKLYFQTASYFLHSGLPDIALEVLSMFPTLQHDEQDVESASVASVDRSADHMINTGTLDFKPQSSAAVDWSKPETSSANDWSKPETSAAVNWSKPKTSSANDWSKSESSFDFDWSKPSRAADIDWGMPEISIKLSDSEESENEEEEKVEEKEITKDEKDEVDASSTSTVNKFDIVALNMKFTCVIQCLIESLKSLPMKCVHENVKLRSALSELLREELSFLHLNCDFGLEKNVSIGWDPFNTLPERHHRRSSTVSSCASYDELSLSEKVDALAMHSEWLRTNHTILSSLYEYCLMVGSTDAQLPAVCLELLLLLHEVEDHHVLSQPVATLSAGPSAPPLLLSSMTSFSLIGSPRAFLQSMAHDLLQTVINLPTLPNPHKPMRRLGDLESLLFSLSSCVYHSLCGGDEDKLLAAIKRGDVQMVGKQDKDGKLMRVAPGTAGVELEPTSSPAQWPGVKLFVAILTSTSRDRSQDVRLLLCEAAVAVYLGMIVSACTKLSSQNLYRLVSNEFNARMWSQVFGGATKIVVHSPPSLEGENPPPSPSAGEKQRNTARMKWNYKLLGKKPHHQGSAAATDETKKLMRHEVFLLPKTTLCDYFLRKPQEAIFDYDSDNEEDVESDDESESEERDLTHKDCSSYAWLIMQLAVVKFTSLNIQEFLSMAGLEISDLPTQSLLLYNATKILLRWEQLLVAQLESTDQDSLIESSPGEDAFQRGGVALHRLKTLLDPDKTPFSKESTAALSARRLWHALVRQEPLRPLFLHYAFASSVYEGNDETDYENVLGRVLHKDYEPVANFCINKINMDFIAISTTHEIIEYDISGSLKLGIFNAFESKKMENLNDEGEEGRSSNPVVIQRRLCSGVRRMDSHPSLPYYVTGGTDGSVRMWEFGHPEQISSFRGASSSERVNKIQFYALGNKFGVVDDSGYLSMWMVSNTQTSAPFLTIRCHSRQCVDFAYLGSSSSIATAGFTKDKRNICIWDTLLPEKKALVHSFVHNAQSLAYVPGQQSLISGGMRGDICVFDIRQRRLLHSFPGHSAAVRTIVFDPAEQIFVTGAFDGEIKVWGLGVHELIEAFPKEHSRATVSLRQLNPGVQCVQLYPGNQMFSCGGDGSVKWRVLKF